MLKGIISNIINKAVKIFLHLFEIIMIGYIILNILYNDISVFNCFKKCNELIDSIIKPNIAEEMMILQTNQSLKIMIGDTILMNIILAIMIIVYIVLRIWISKIIKEGEYIIAKQKEIINEIYG